MKLNIAKQPAGMSLKRKGRDKEVGIAFKDTPKALWERSGDALGRSGDTLGRSRGALGTLWGALGMLWEALGPLWGRFGALWKRAGELCGYGQG